MLKASEFWDREVTAPLAPPSHSWTAHPDVRRYVNRAVGGAEGTWPLDWFQTQYPGITFNRVLSIGCGSGAFERDLIRRGLTHSIDAFDASPASIDAAQKTAAAEDIGDSIRYWIDDFNTIRLQPSAYDLVCFHQSLHHVDALEHLLRQVRRALRPGGMLYLDEFIGPSRTYWNDDTARWYRAVYQMFPRDVRYFEEFPMPVQQEDPSEAVRSSEIYSRLVIGFSIENFRGYGGNVLAVLFPGFIVDRLTKDQVGVMIALEEALLGAGAPHFHAVIVARPKPGAGAALADLRYRVEHRFPAITRLFRSILRGLRGQQETYW